VTLAPEQEHGGLRGRDRELAELEALVTRARTGTSGALVVSGEAGIGKSALLDRLVGLAAPQVRVHRMVASESEGELAYAGLQQLCGHMLGAAAHLPPPQAAALEAAFGLRSGAPSPFLVGLAVLGLLTEAAGDRALLVVIDDAQWLDVASARAVAVAARRLEAEGVAIVLSMRTVGPDFADLPRLALAGLGSDDARALLALAVPGTIDRRVRDQLIAEAGGNPMALQELPRALSPAEIAGGYALAASLPLEHRIEASLLAQLAPLPDRTRMLLLLAAADPTGDPRLLWRASALLGLAPADVDAAEQAGALTVGTRVGFRHPLVRSAVYRAATAEDRRRAHAALAEATDPERDPDRRAWHRAAATLLPDEDVAADLERSAQRARERGGVAAAAAFLERAAELSPDPGMLARRLIAAAEAKHDAGAQDAALGLLDAAGDLPLTALQQAQVVRLRARSEYELHRDRSGPRRLLAAAQRLEGLDDTLARDTYIEALSAALYAGRLGDAGVVDDVARAILEATKDDDSDRARDLILRGQALLAVHGRAAALPTLRRALRAFRDDEPDDLELRWMWFGCQAARDLLDEDDLRALAARQVELARAEGVLTVLPIALNFQMAALLLDGRLDRFAAICDEVDAIQSVTASPLPPYGRIIGAAFRGRVEEVEARAERFLTDAQARGEGNALAAVHYAQAVVYNSAGRFADAVASARRDLAYTHEASFSARALPELVEAAVRTGDHALAAEALEHLTRVTEPEGDVWARGVTACARAQVSDDFEQAELLHRAAIEHFTRGRMPLLEGRARLVYGERLRAGGGDDRAEDAREQLRAAHALLDGCGAAGFAARAARELAGTGETLRIRAPEAIASLTDQELNVARLAREGLTNRDIGARLFISARTAEYHLRKVFVKLGLSSRAELKGALAELD
jgi:DNA-binding CsgD family transcriptional regulator